MVTEAFPEAHKLITGAFLEAHKLIRAAFPDAQIDYRSFSKTVFDQEMFVGCFTMKQKMCVHYNNVLSSY